MATRKSLGDSVFPLIDMYQRNKLNEAELQLARDREARLERESTARLGQMGIQNRLAEQQISSSEQRERASRLQGDVSAEALRLAKSTFDANVNKANKDSLIADEQYTQAIIQTKDDFRTDYDATAARTVDTGFANNYIALDEESLGKDSNARHRLTPEFYTELADGNQNAIRFASDLANDYLRNSNASVVGVDFEKDKDGNNTGRMLFRTIDPNKPGDNKFGVITIDGSSNPDSKPAFSTIENTFRKLETSLNGGIIPGALRSPDGSRAMQSNNWQRLQQENQQLSGSQAVENDKAVSAAYQTADATSPDKTVSRALVDTASEFDDEEQRTQFLQEIGIQMPAGAAPEFGSDAETQFARETDVRSQEESYGVVRDRYQRAFSNTERARPPLQNPGGAGPRISTSSLGEVTSDLPAGMAEIKRGVRTATRQTEQQYNQAVNAQKWFKDNSNAMAERFANSEGGALEEELNTLGGRAFYEKYKDTDFANTPDEVFRLYAQQPADAAGLVTAAQNGTLPQADQRTSDAVRKVAEANGIDPRGSAEQIRNAPSALQIAIGSQMIGSAGSPDDQIKMAKAVENLIGTGEVGTSQADLRKEAREEQGLLVDKASIQLRFSTLNRNIANDAELAGTNAATSLQKLNESILDEEGDFVFGGKAKAQMDAIVNRSNNPGRDGSAHSKLLVPALTNYIKAAAESGEFDQTWLNSFADLWRDDAEFTIGDVRDRLVVDADIVQDANGSPRAQNIRSFTILDGAGNPTDEVSAKDMSAILGPRVMQLLAVNSDMVRNRNPGGS